MRTAVASLLASLVLIAAAWWWAGAPIAVPPSPLPAGAKLNCVSYTPFRRGQTPFNLDAHATAAEIDADFTRLSAITDCVRTYAVDQGLDQVPEIAAKHGLSVILGLWIGSDPAANALQISRGLQLANAYPKTVRLLVVGNETLLRGEITARSLAAILQSVRARTSVPVTYADVWEYWLKNTALAQDVDVVTIHILPYWEDDPIGAAAAAAHVAQIYRRMEVAFPGKPLLVGETGYPSQGRMRDVARPSPAGQVRALSGIVAWARRSGAQVNYIEAFDQPWKRLLEGTAGGYWGLLDADTRAPKFTWGVPISNHPYWIWRAVGGGALALVLFAVAAVARRKDAPPGAGTWAVLGVLAAVAGVSAGLAAEYWLLAVRSLIEDMQAGVALGIAILLPLGAAALYVRRQAPAGLTRLLAAPPAPRRTDWWVGLLAAGLAVQGLELALGLAFDPRYRGFPASSFAGPVLALAMLGLQRRRWGRSALTERVFAALLLATGVTILVQEGLRNFEAIAFVACVVILAGILAVAPSAPAPEAAD